MAHQNTKIETKPVVTARQGAAREVVRHLTEVLNLQDCLNDSKDILRLHAWRKTTRTMRYTLEIFQNQLFLDATPLLKNAIAVTEKLQQYLGAIHDADILVPHFTFTLVEILHKGAEVNNKATPIVGTDLIDWKLCMGLLKLCMLLQYERNLQFEALTRYYMRVQKKQTFEKLLALCQEPSQA